MPAVATSFGRVLGPVGKMPSPQLGILMNVDDKSINEVLAKINNCQLNYKIIEYNYYNDYINRGRTKDEESFEGYSFPGFDKPWRFILVPQGNRGKNSSL